MPNVTITLETLTAVRHGDIWGRAEPYMWNFFFGIDSPPVEDPPSPGYALTGLQPLLFTPANGRFGNLGVTNVSTGQSISIPTDIGRMALPFTPPVLLDAGAPPPATERNFASVGVVSMLLERDWYSDVGAAAGYAEMRMLLQSRLEAMILSQPEQPAGTPAFRPADVKNAIAPLIQNGLPGQVRAAVLGAQGLLRNVASLLHPDDLLGMEVLMWDTQQLVTAPIPFFGTYDRKGLWQVEGQVTT